MRAAATPAAEAPTFYVADNGMGIDPKYHEKVFGLFERLEPEASEGTGTKVFAILGLTGY